MLLRCLWIVAVAVSCSQAASPHKEPVAFSFTQDVGDGNSVFVVGNHPDIGAWDVTRAVKLRFTAGNVWTGQIAIQAGTPLEYRFVSRATAPGLWCNPANATYLTGPLTLSVPPQPAAPYQGKTLYYLSGWNSTNLFYRSGATWISAAMAKIGNGRVAGEFLYKISGIGEAGEVWSSFLITVRAAGTTHPAAATT